jgi:hypothetical protein
MRSSARVGRAAVVIRYGWKKDWKKEILSQ